MQVDQRVTARSEAGALAGVLVRGLEIRPGNAAMYYPEANVLVPRLANPASRTPAFKRRSKVASGWTIRKGNSLRSGEEKGCQAVSFSSRSAIQIFRSVW